MRIRDQRRGLSRLAGEAVRCARRRGPAVAGIAGPAVFWGVLTGLGYLQPAYNPFRYEISLLALGAHGWWQTASFIVFGLSAFLFNRGLHRAVVPERRWGAIRVLALVFGTGFMALAIFPTDRSPYTPTLHGLIHKVIAGILTLLFPVACFAFARAAMRHASWRGHVRFTTVAGALTLALLLAWGGAWASLRPWIGLYERAVVAVPSIWMEVTAIQLLRRS
jgi:hypothetical protein